MQTWCKPGSRPIHISIGVKCTDLDGTRLRRYLVVSNAYPYKDVGSVEKLIIDLTIFNRVRFLLSTTPFCCRVPGVVNWDIIPCSLRKESNSLDIYSPPQSNRSALRCLPNWLSDSALNSMNLSKASDFLSTYPNLEYLSVK